MRNNLKRDKIVMHGKVQDMNLTYYDRGKKQQEVAYKKKSNILARIWNSFKSFFDFFCFGGNRRVETNELPVRIRDFGYGKKIKNKSFRKKFAGRKQKRRNIICQSAI